MLQFLAALLCAVTVGCTDGGTDAAPDRRPAAARTSTNDVAPNGPVIEAGEHFARARARPERPVAPGVAPALSNEGKRQTLHADERRQRRATEAVDCQTSSQRIDEADLNGLTGAALVTYLSSRDSACIMSAPVLFANQPLTHALWSEANVRLVAETAAARSASNAASNPQEVLSLLAALYAADYVQYNSGGAIATYSEAARAALGNALAQVGASAAFSSPEGAQTVSIVFATAHNWLMGDRVFQAALAYLRARELGGDAFKTDAHFAALHKLFLVLYRHNVAKPAAWAALVGALPANQLESFKRMAMSLSFVLSPDPARWQAHAQAPANAVREFLRFMEFTQHRSAITASVPELLASYPRLSSPWLAVATSLDYYQADACGNWGLCKSTLATELKAKAFPNTFSFDDGKVIVYTAVSKNKTQQLYHAMKQVEAQYKAVTQHLTALSDDPNPSLKMFVYGSKSEYNDLQGFLFNLDSNNGGIYIESEGTFYTYERTPAESIYTLEELLRHEYVHYLSSRYTIPGMWGQAPLYSNERLTWFEEGIAEFFAGATQSDGIQQRKNKIQGIVRDGANRMTLAQIVTAKYGDFRFYDYATALTYFLHERRPQDFTGLFDSLRRGDAAAFDALASRLAATQQTDFSSFTDGLVAKYPSLPPFQEGAAYDPARFALSDAPSIQQQVQAQLPGAACAEVYQSMNLRVACSGPLPAGGEAALKVAIKTLAASSVHNFKTLVCHPVLQNPTPRFYCEVGIRNPQTPLTANRAPTLTDRGSTTVVTSGATACLRADATDADGDSLGGVWRQTGGLGVTLGRGQLDVGFGACVAPTPGVEVPERVDFELLVGDGYDARQLHRSFIIQPMTAPALQVTQFRNGPWDSFSLSLTLNSLAPLASSPGEVYVAAFWNGLWFFLQPSGEWSTTAAPWWRGVLQAPIEIPVLNQLNVSALHGAQVFVGYGRDFGEMVQAQRYTRTLVIP